jgi:EAL domain-containing protein (putative c-di-GMP-specific phosphodiesterase class I)
MTLLELRRADRTRSVVPERGDPEELGGPARLRDALDSGELVLRYQPMVELQTGRPRGFEALIRWQHPALGLVPPAAFMPAVETSRLVLPVGRFVLHEALRLFADLRALGATAELFGMAVNVSPIQLEDSDFAGRVLRELEAHRMRPERLALELTETADLLDDTLALRALTELREAGVHVSVDDYGTGYSSLTRVLDLPIDALKIDAHITQRLPDPRARAMVRSTMQLCQDLDISVVVEGVERVDQRDLLLELGCRWGQGYLFGRAVPAEQVAGILLPEAVGPRLHAHDHELVVAADQDSGISSVARVMGDALLGEGLVLHIGTPEERRGVAARLEGAGIPVGALIAEGRFVQWDSKRFVQKLTTSEGIDVGRVDALVVPLVGHRAAQNGLTVSSSAGHLLWQADRVADSLVLEDHVNGLHALGNVRTVCCFHRETLATIGTREQVARIRDQHSHVTL